MSQKTDGPDFTKAGGFKLPYQGRYRKSSSFDFPRFRLNKKDEKARIMIIDPEPTCVFRHWVLTGLRDPDSQGVVKGKYTYTLCLSPVEVLLKDEPDKDACPLCANGEDSREDVAISAAKFNAATHIIRYMTTPQGTLSVMPGQPPGFQLELWVFGRQTFNQLIDLKEQYGNDAFRQHDLLCTCETASFQKMSILPLPQAVWLEKEYTQKEGNKVTGGLALLIASLYNESKLKNVAEAMGRNVGREEADKIVAKALEVKAGMAGRGVEPASSGRTPQQVESALNEAQGEAAKAAADSINMDELFGGGAAKPVEATSAIVAPPQVAPEVAATPEVAIPVETSTGDNQDFEDMLKGA